MGQWSHARESMARRIYSPLHFCVSVKVEISKDTKIQQTRGSSDSAKPSLDLIRRFKNQTKAIQNIYKTTKQCLIRQNLPHTFESFELLYVRSQEKTEKNAEV